MTILFIIALLSLSIGALASLILQKDGRLAHGVSSFFAGLGLGCTFVLSLLLLTTRTTLDYRIATGFPYFDITVHIDQFAALFFLIISTIGLASVIYGYGYIHEHVNQYSKAHNVGYLGFFFNIFVGSMLLVVSAYNGIYFLFVWEVMALASLFLVFFKHQHADTQRAGIIYFVMTHIATMFILFAFILLFMYTGSLDFSVIKQHAGSIPWYIQNLIFVGFLIGFGTKSGIIPLHIWLPRAHSVAPTHVSALMSGVMIKMGIFMMIRMFFDVVPFTQLWGGVTILVIGGVSSVVGVLYALSEHDIKRLLAYHSIENIGIILLGVGSSLIFLSLHMPAMAMLALGAGIFHTINHAVFKSLLFFGAGAVINATHSRNIESYGGLIKKMPYTALFFLIGAMAISGLPPLNGFASEWVTYQGLFVGFTLHGMFLKILFISAVGALALTGGLAAACFVKAFGITFLARPRSQHTAQAVETSFSLLFAMGVLAALCIGIGFFAGPVLDGIKYIVSTFSLFSPSVAPVSTSIISISLFEGLYAISMPIIFLGIVIALGATYGWTYLTSNQQKEVIGDVWDCGFSHVTPRMEVTASAFSRTLIVIFKYIFFASRKIDLSSDSEIVTHAKTVHMRTKEVFENYVYQQFQPTLDYISRNVNKLQNGNTNRYILYMVAILIALLLWFNKSI
jgi:hydrogenase-4 component B